MGGDLIAGTNFVDALKIFEHDNDTEGIILIGEVGGTAELEAAAWVTEYNKRTSNPKPISALVAGVQVSERADPSRRAMGHVSLYSANVQDHAC
jgi:succinyl-CoA synthetase alpha subunit